MQRREFLKKAIKFFFSVLFISSSAVAGLFLYPSKIRKKQVRFFEVMKEEELPRRGVKKVVFQIPRGDHLINTRVFFVNNGGSLFVLSPVCTHLGCLVNWHRQKGEFICPCHGGRYSIEGKVLGGPPPRPLTRLPFKVEKGKVYVGLKV